MMSAGSTPAFRQTEGLRKRALATRSGLNWQASGGEFCFVMAGRCGGRWGKPLPPGPFVADGQQFHRAVRDHDPEGGAEGALDEVDIAIMGADQLGGDRKTQPA